MHHLFPTSSHREYVRCFNSSDWLTSMSWTTLQSIAQKIKSSVQTLNSHTEFPGSHMKVIFCQVLFFLNKGRSYCNISFLDVSIFSVHTSLFTLDADFKAIGTEETSRVPRAAPREMQTPFTEWVSCVKHASAIKQKTCLWPLGYLWGRGRRRFTQLGLVIVHCLALCWWILGGSKLISITRDKEQDRDREIYISGKVNFNLWEFWRCLTSLWNFHVVLRIDHQYHWPSLSASS